VQNSKVEFCHQRKLPSIPGFLNGEELVQELISADGTTSDMAGRANLGVHAGGAITILNQ
jgi:hypothetical protein